jgi:hypothetical protein
MRSAAVCVCALAILLCGAARAAAQDPPKPISLFVVDVRGTMPRFPSSNDGLAASRGLQATELPGSGFGIDIGAHIYPLKWKAVTFGVGGQLTLGRSHSSGGTTADGFTKRPVTEHFTAIAPQLSFNFGTGAGWSYLSGGYGPGVWSIVPDGNTSLASDDERLTVYNYGGGARWFAKEHLAFTFDVRFWDIYGGTALLGFPGSPRVKMLVLGAGVSLK